MEGREIGQHPQRFRHGRRYVHPIQIEFPQPRKIPNYIPKIRTKETKWFENIEDTGKIQRLQTLDERKFDWDEAYEVRIGEIEVCRG
ncbi:hypothetical protein MRB53_009484 [Persea americana]|uniref:Uncharacterized protein n=1 Tax=Persea americana TaxID=3435 RepID=A0ACC2LP47_PERAE|nr:hypothetical protein MRB53_009484 [Persea americana]